MDGLDLYVIDLSEYEFHGFIHLLDENEMKRVNDFLLPGPRESFVIRKALLRLILSDYTNIPPQEIKILYSETGKPFIHEHHNIHFNTSSRDNQAVIALSANPVGIDIEKISYDYEEVMTLSSRFFAASEYEKILSCAPAEAITLFYRFWTAKEAVAKLKGMGISDYIGINVLNKDFLTHNQLHVTQADIKPDFSISFASNHVITEIKQIDILSLNAMVPFQNSK